MSGSVFIYPPTVATVDTGGLATEGKQDVMITELVAINAELDGQTTLLTSIDGKDFATETTLAALAATDFATETTLAALNAKVTAVDTGNVTISGALPAGTNNIGDVDVVSSVLPTGAATEATLASIDGKITAVDTSALATEVTLAALNAKVTAVDTGNVTISTALPAGTNNIGDVDVVSSVLPTGAATETTLATLATEATLSTLNGKVTAVDTGSVTISTALPAGTNNIGDVDVVSSVLPTGAATSANQSTIITELQTLTAGLDVVDQIDTTPLLDVSSSNIPASAGNPLQIVASTAAAVRKLVVVEDIGEFIGIYTGAALSEVLLAVLPLGGGEIEVNIPASTRVSLRHMKNTAITSDFIAINFLG